jgi:hypothetical protein
MRNESVKSFFDLGTVDMAMTCALIGVLRHAVAAAVAG